MNALITLLVIAAGIFLVLGWSRRRKGRWKVPEMPFPPDWRIILAREVSFYHALSPEEKGRFEYKVQEFLLNCRITGIETRVDITDRLLVASSAVIPIFGFPGWKYVNLQEQSYDIPWIDLMGKKIEEICRQDSDINPSGGTSRAEFFSVASEYFFERPKLLARNHPELYHQLEHIFKQNMSTRKLRKTVFCWFS